MDNDARRVDPAVMAKRFEISLLGRFQVVLSGSADTPFPIESRKRQALLAYLAMRPHFTETRERLADLLWGDRLDKQARQSLRQSLVSLRRELAAAGDDLLAIDGDTVGFRPGSIAVDAREFLELAVSDEPADRLRAAELHRGVFLAGAQFDELAFSEWLRGERLRVSAAARLLFERMAADAERSGDGAAALAAAQRLVALDPLREDAQRLLLRLEAQHRGREAAAARATTLLDFLREELDTDPEPETAALIAELKRDRAGAAQRENGADEDEGDREAAVVGRVPVAPTDARRNPAHPRALAWSLAVVLIGVAAWLSARHWPAASVPPSAPLTVPAQASGDPSWHPPPIAARPAPAASGFHALVVLPFTTEASGRSPEQTLADRISDDLINDLSRIPSLRVISRATSRTYRDRPVDVAALGGELGVGYVIEGDLRMQDSRMRLNVALTDAKSRLQVWSDRFERDRAERPVVQDDLVRAIGRALHVSVLLEEDRRRPPASDPDAADLLAKGWAAMLRIGQAGITSGADGYFEEALKREPDNVSALVGVGAYNVSVVAMFLVAEPEPHLGKAEPALRRAIELNPSASLAHYFLGILHKTRGEPKAALASFTRVLEINPSFAPAYAQTGHVLSRIGGLEEALEHVRYAIRISPKDPNLGLWSLFGGQITLEQGKDDMALEWLSRAAALDPRSPFIHATLAAIFGLRGDAEKSTMHAAEVKRLAPWLTPQRMMERLVGLSAEGSPPVRLYEGLRIAFAGQY